MDLDAKTTKKRDFKTTSHKDPVPTDDFTTPKSKIDKDQIHAVSTAPKDRTACDKLKIIFRIIGSILSLITLVS